MKIQKHFNKRNLIIITGLLLVGAVGVFLYLNSNSTQKQDSVASSNSQALEDTDEEELEVMINECSVKVQNIPYSFTFKLNPPAPIEYGVSYTLSGKDCTADEEMFQKMYITLDYLEAENSDVLPVSNFDKEKFYISSNGLTQAGTGKVYLNWENAEDKKFIGTFEVKQDPYKQPEKVSDFSIEEVYPITYFYSEEDFIDYYKKDKLNITQSLFLIYIDLNLQCSKDNEEVKECEEAYNWTSVSFYAQYPDGSEKHLYTNRVGEMDINHNKYTLYRGYNIAAYIFEEEGDYNEAKIVAEVSNIEEKKEVLKVHRSKVNFTEEPHTQRYVQIHAFEAFGDYVPIENVQVTMEEVDKGTKKTLNTNKFGHAIIDLGENYKEKHHKEYLLKYQFPHKVDYEQVYLTNTNYRDKQSDNSYIVNLAHRNDIPKIEISEKPYDHEDYEYYISDNKLFRFPYNSEVIVNKNDSGGVNIKDTNSDTEAKITIEEFEGTLDDLYKYAQEEYASYDCEYIPKGTSDSNGETVSLKYTSEGKVYRVYYFIVSSVDEKVLKHEISQSQSAEEGYSSEVYRRLLAFLEVY